MFLNLFHKNIVHYILIFILFSFLAVILLNIPILEIDNQLPQHIDAYLVSWVWSWEAHILPTNPLNLFQANIFAPFNNTLAFTETMLGSFLLALPILLIFNNIILAYNLVVIFSFAISGLGMYLLVYYLTKNKWAALLSALIYAFAPFKLIQSIGHLHLTGMWLPYVFLYLHKFFKNQSWKNILLLTLFILLIFLTGLHYFIFLSIVILTFTLFFLLARSFRFNKNNIKKIILSLFVLLIITVPLLLPYFQVKQEYSLTRTIESIQNYSPSLIDYFISPFFYKGFGSYTKATISPGIFVILLFILSLYSINKNKNSTNSPGINFLIYSTIAIIAFLISFGFYIKLYPNHSYQIPGIYSIFYFFIPGFSGIRSVGRYSIFVLLAISVFIGYAAALWHKYIKDSFKRMLLFFLIISFLLLEFSFVPPVSYSYPESDREDYRQLYSWVKEQPNSKIFLELPMGFKKDKLLTNYDIMYVFASSQHFKRIVNGYSGYYPPGYLELMEDLKIFEPQKDISHIKKFQVDYLIFHFDRYDNKEKIKATTLEGLKQNSDMVLVTNFSNSYIYQIIYD